VPPPPPPPPVRSLAASRPWLRPAKERLAAGTDATAVADASCRRRFALPPPLPTLPSCDSCAAAAAAEPTEGKSLSQIAPPAESAFV